MSVEGPNDFPALAQDGWRDLAIERIVRPFTSGLDDGS